VIEEMLEDFDGYELSEFARFALARDATTNRQAWIAAGVIGTELAAWDVAGFINGRVRRAVLGYGRLGLPERGLRAVATAALLCTLDGLLLGAHAQRLASDSGRKS
jgi:hypothetical protein